jgi:hypothetical protein
MAVVAKQSDQPQQQGVPRQNDYLGTGHKFSPCPFPTGSLGRIQSKRAVASH